MGQPKDVIRVVDSLRGKLAKAGMVRDPELRRVILDAHADSGMEEDTTLYVVLAPPAAPDALAKLEAFCREILGAGLTKDLRAFLERHDGMWLTERDEGDDSTAEELIGDGYDEGVLGVEGILSAMKQLLIVETMPDGRRTKDTIGSLLPFFMLSNAGWHALKYRSREPSPKVVAFYPDDGPEDAQTIASSFGEWLELWIDGGFYRSWYNHDQ